MDWGQGSLDIECGGWSDHSVHLSIDSSRISDALFLQEISFSGQLPSIWYVLLLTIIHLLKPNIFKMNTEDPLYREHFLSGLRKEPFGGPAGTFQEDKVISMGPYRIMRNEHLKGISSLKMPVFKIILEGVNGRLKGFVEKDGKPN